MRAHSILLSSKGIGINEIAKIYQVHRNSVSSWIDKWETSGGNGLYDQPRSGSPPKLNEKEQEVAKDLIKAHPNAPKRVVALLAGKMGKTISRSSLRRIAKEAGLPVRRTPACAVPVTADRQTGLRWKRVRKSLKTKRDDEAFDQAKKEIEGLKKTSIRNA